MSWGGNYEWREYVPVAKKKSMAAKYAAKIAKKQGRQPAPVTVPGRKIATTFWGRAWCENLEAYSDFANRLPRGATYVRNGSVVDLVIETRKIEAIVAGSDPYKVAIRIEPLAKKIWQRMLADCSTAIDSLLDLLSGRLSDGVMERLTRPKDGLFPSPREIKLSCSCPDYSHCCKHIAAVMYGVGSRLDTNPELLFLLRDVDQQELVSQAVAEGNLNRELGATSNSSLAAEDLGELFGIDLDTQGESQTPQNAETSGKRKSAKTTRTASKPRASSRRPSRKVAVPGSGQAVAPTPARSTRTPARSTRAKSRRAPV